MTIYTKVCSTCKLTKDTTLFSKDKTRKDGHHRMCKACQKAYYDANKLRYNQQSSEYREANRDQINERRRDRYEEYYEANKDHIKEYRQEYYQTHKDQYKEHDKAYYEANKQLRNEQCKEYRDGNKDQILIYQKQYRKKRKARDPLYALTIRIRDLIGHSLRKNRYTKKSRTYEILGCSYEEFMVHIESQFVEGMSWDNRDKWHIDHRVPVSWGQTEEEVIALNHYTNLKPMWALDNIQKNNHYAE